MKYSALLVAYLLTAAMTAPVIAQSKIPASLHQYPKVLLRRWRDLSRHHGQNECRL